MSTNLKCGVDPIGISILMITAIKTWLAPFGCFTQQNQPNYPLAKRATAVSDATTAAATTAVLVTVPAVLTLALANGPVNFIATSHRTNQELTYRPLLSLIVWRQM
jgi:hypothetical protein